MGYRLNIIGERSLDRAPNPKQGTLLPPVVEHRSLGEEYIDLQADDSPFPKYGEHLTDYSFLTGFLHSGVCLLPFGPENWHAKRKQFNDRYAMICQRDDVPYALVHDFAFLNTRHIGVQSLVQFNYDQPAVIRGDHSLVYDDFGLERREHYRRHPSYSSYRQLLSKRFFELLQYLEAERFRSVIFDVA